MTKIILATCVILGLTGCASSPKLPQQNMSASYYDMKEESFSLQAIAPAQVIREYAICKATWFAEKKKAAKFALSDPIYGNQSKGTGMLASSVPEGWTIVDTTAYLSEPKPTSNPFVNVAEMTSQCRSGWEWYR